MLSYADIRPKISSFDLLFFSGEGLISSAIKLASGSKWSHVGMALVLPGYDQVLCYESTTLSDVPSIETGKKVKGVMLVPLSQRVATYEGELGWMHLSGERKEDMKLTMAAFVREFAGRPYETNQLELIRAALDIITLKQNQPDASSVFCAELMALALRRLGVLSLTMKPANEFTPGDLASPSLQLTPRWRSNDVVEYAAG